MSSIAILYPAPEAVPATAGPLQGAQRMQAFTTTESISVNAATLSGSGLVAAGSPSKDNKLAAFEGFLKRAGHIAGIVLTDIVKYVIPVASVVAIADPAAAPVIEAFTASVKLVQATVISVQQKWATEGSGVNPQKLSDVLEIVQQPVTTMFAQVGVQVDTAYVTNLINGVVAILNAQPGVILPKGA